MEMMRQHSAFEPRVVLTPNAPSFYKDYLLRHIRSPKSIVVLAEEEGRIVGFCCAYMCQNLPMFSPSEFGYVSDLAVTEDYQKKGIGSAILQNVTNWFKRYDIDCIQLQVYSQNALGRKFWQSKGFTSFVERHWLDI